MSRTVYQNLVEVYVEWLRSNISVENFDNGCELTTPFLDRHNDHIQVYARRDGNKIVLTDDGYILADLRTSGLDMNTPKREAVLDTVLAGLGVRRDGRQLVVEASESGLGQRLHSLIQAMLAVNDMFVMAQPRVETFFWEDVRAFLNSHNVRYSERVKLAGRSGYDHAIDFLIPRSQRRPERLLQTINAPNKNTIGGYLFSLGDTREARGDDSEAYAFLNDRDRKVGGDVIEALETYSVKPALWTKREQYAEALAN